MHNLTTEAGGSLFDDRTSRSRPTRQFSPATISTISQVVSATAATMTREYASRTDLLHPLKDGQLPTGDLHDLLERLVADPRATIPIGTRHM